MIKANNPLNPNKAKTLFKQKHHGQAMQIEFKNKAAKKEVI